MHKENPNKNPFEESINFNKIFDTKFYKENKSVKSLDSFLESMEKYENSNNNNTDIEEEKISTNKVIVIDNGEGVVYGVFDNGDTETLVEYAKKISRASNSMVYVTEYDKNKLDLNELQGGTVGEFKNGEEYSNKNEEDMEEGISNLVSMIPDNVIQKVGSVISELLDNERVDESKVEKLQNSIEKKIRRKSPDTKDFIIDAISTGNFNLGEVLVAVLRSTKTGNV